MVLRSWQPGDTGAIGVVYDLASVPSGICGAMTPLHAWAWPTRLCTQHGATCESQTWALLGDTHGALALYQV